MLTDAYDNPLHTSSETARDAYVAAMTDYLEASPGVRQQLDRALEADEGFALAYALKARDAQVYGRMSEAKALMAQAMDLAGGIEGQMKSHLKIFDHLINSRVREGYAAVRAHLVDFPRDALVAQTSMGVFSLIGFSGQAGREAEYLALAEALAPAYGDDAWFLSQLAFAQMETGQLGPAHRSIEASLTQRPRSAHGAHIRAHLFYEEGQSEDGLRFLSDWMASYPRDGMMHCHNAWHCALWALGQGDEAEMWRIVDEDLAPEQSVSPALNIMTDLASLYHRAGLAGVDVPAERWQALSNYAASAFPKTGLGFADVHAALSHAMAGDEAALTRIVEGASGPAADQVAPCAQVFGAVARGNWVEAEALLLPVMATHERLGGSRAQRDLLEYTLLHALIRQGKADEARRLVVLRRPKIDTRGAVVGLD